MNVILDRISKGLHVSLSRFNDGECGALMSDLTVTSREKQLVTESLIEKLQFALSYRAKGYYIGIPCPECYPEYYHFVKDALGTYKNQLLAVSTTNHNYNVFKSHLLELLKTKDVAVLMNTEVILPLENVTFYRCPSMNAEDKSEDILENFSDHDYYILTAGAVSRYLAAKLHERGKNALDLGSIFDPGKGKPLKAHVWDGVYRNLLSHCPICNY